MANCSGATTITPTPNCFSSSAQSINQINCGCTPCDQPVIVNPGDVSNQVLVPILADVIQNCICLSKYEPAFPTDLIVTTNLLKAPATGSGQTVPSGTICITNVSYSYSCVGVPGTIADGATAATVPTIDATVGSSQIVLTGTTPSCSCTATGATVATPLYNDFAAVVTTPSCCCNQISQAYAQNKIIERNVAFSVCNLTISVTGTIGDQAFTGTIGFADTTATPTGITAIASPEALESLAFPATLNFAGIMCLPTNTRLTINETLDNCLIVDCVRPNSATYSVATDPTTAPAGGTATDSSTFANFLASADLSLVISKNIYATLSQKLAVMTNAGSQVVCADNTTVPACPQGTPCAGTTPCPGPATAPIA